MSILENHLKFVNEQIEFQQKTLGKLVATKQSPAKQAFHQSLIVRLENLLNFLMSLKEAGVAPLDDEVKPIKLSLTPRDVEGLPEELLKELSIGEDNTEFAILRVLEDCGGIASLDQLLVGIYRKTGEVLKRPGLTSRLYRMAQKDLVWGVPGKKGVYSSKPISETQATVLFGADQTPA